MTVSISQLEKSIDTIARRCPRGLAALTGEAGMPSADELEAAALWRPSEEVFGGKSQKAPDDTVVNRVARIAELTTPIEEVGWDKIVKAVLEVKNLYPLPWEIYRLHCVHVNAGDEWQDGGGSLKKIAEYCGVSVPTVTRWRHLVPRRIAKVALN